MSEDDDLSDDEREVQRKRLLESMDSDVQRAKLAALLQNEDVRDLLWRLIEKAGIFADPMNPNFGNVAYGLGKAAIGKQLLAEINEADPIAWREMQVKAATVAAAARTQKPRARRP